MFDQEALGMRMRAVRQSAGLSVRNCSRRMGTPKSCSHLYHCENGLLCPSITWLARLAEACGTTVKAILSLNPAQALAGDSFVMEIAPMVKALTPTNRQIVLDVLRDLEFSKRHAA